MSDSTPQAYVTAKHEAGHAVAAYLSRVRPRQLDSFWGEGGNELKAGQVAGLFRHGFLATPELAGHFRSQRASDPTLRAGYLLELRKARAMIRFCVAGAVAAWPARKRLCALGALPCLAIMGGLSGGVSPSDRAGVVCGLEVLGNRGAKARNVLRVRRVQRTIRAVQRLFARPNVAAAIEALAEALEARGRLEEEEILAVLIPHLGAWPEGELHLG